MGKCAYYLREGGGQDKLFFGVFVTTVIVFGLGVWGFFLVEVFPYLSSDYTLRNILSFVRMFPLNTTEIKR